jgi:CheY-like chemotaxis protein
LTQSQPQARCAHCGCCAIAAAQTFKPHVVLLDIGMPRISGYEVAQALRSDASGPKPVLVAVTGLRQDADTQRAPEAGLQYHHVKPMSEAVLRRILTAVAASAGEGQPGGKCGRE